MEAFLMKKSPKTLHPVFFLALSALALPISGCIDFGEMPSYPVDVLGFASTCGRGASVKIIHDTHPERHEVSMRKIEVVGDVGREQVEVVSTPTGIDGPFVVRVGEWSCPFTTSSGYLVQEATCVRDNSSAEDDMCFARLNFQGTRSPTLPPFSSTVWRSWEEGSWSPTPAEALFAKPDLADVRAFDELEKERVQNRHRETGVDGGRA